MCFASNWKSGSPASLAKHASFSCKQRGKRRAAAAEIENDEFLQRIRDLRQTDEVHLHLYRQSRGVLIDGRPLADLPPSVLSVMRGAKRSGVEEDLPAELVHEERVNIGRFVAGGHDVLIDVRKEKP